MGDGAWHHDAEFILHDRQQRLEREEARARELAEYEASQRQTNKKGENKMSNTTKLTIKGARLSYAHVFKKHSIQGGDPKYSCQIIIDKDHPQIEKIEAAIAAAAKGKFPKLVNGNKVSAKLKTPLRDGDDEENEKVYADKYFFNSSNTQPPMTIGRRKEQIVEEDNVIYSGCYANVNITFYAFDTNGNKGVAASLGGVQFVKDGEALGGNPTTIDDFDEEDDFDDEMFD